MISTVLTYDCGIIKKSVISYTKGDPISAAYSIDSYSNTWTASSRVCIGWIRNFYRKLEEVSMVAKKTEFALRSFNEQCDEDDGLINPCGTLETEIEINTSNFEDYEVNHDSEITVNLKYLKNIFYFADSVKGSIKTLFEEPGNPVIFRIEIDPNYSEVEFALASLKSIDNTYGSQSMEEFKSNYNNHGLSSTLMSNPASRSTLPECSLIIDNPIYSQHPFRNIQTNIQDACSDNENEEVPPSPISQYCNNSYPQNLPLESSPTVIQTHTASLTPRLSKSRSPLGSLMESPQY